MLLGSIPINSLMVALKFLNIKGKENGNKGQTSLTCVGVIGESSDTRHDLGSGVGGSVLSSRRT